MEKGMLKKEKKEKKQKTFENERTVETGWGKS